VQCLRILSTCASQLERVLYYTRLSHITLTQLVTTTRITTEKSHIHCTALVTPLPFHSHSINSATPKTGLAYIAITAAVENNRHKVQFEHQLNCNKLVPKEHKTRLSNRLFATLHNAHNQSHTNTHNTHTHTIHTTRLHRPCTHQTI